MITIEEEQRILIEYARLLEENRELREQIKYKDFLIADLKKSKAALSNNKAKKETIHTNLTRGDRVVITGKTKKTLIFPIGFVVEVIDVKNEKGFEKIMFDLMTDTRVPQYSYISSNAYDWAKVPADTPLSLRILVESKHKPLRGKGCTKVNSEGEEKNYIYEYRNVMPLSDITNLIND